LADSTVFHRAVKVLGIHALANRALRALPVTRTFVRPGGKAVRYRARYLESFLLADEIFERGIYDVVFEGIELETFIDLGCNVGYFVCCAGSFAVSPRDVIGLAVDGNAEMAADTRWHTAENGLRNVHVEHGAAGFPLDVNEVTFYENPSNVASSAQPNLNPNVPNKGASRAVRVPVVHVYERWKEIAGDKRVNVLKIDVEGTECSLLEVESELLRVTDRIVIEWHKWTTSLGAVTKILNEAGFCMMTLIGEDDNAGVAVFVRDPSSVRSVAS